MNNTTKYILFQCRTVQPFRVTHGKSYWIFYEVSDTREWNLRQILDDEIVIEFDTDDKDLAWKGINFTAINLFNAGYRFEIWDHGGKSPHIHIRNCPIAHLDKDKLRSFKKFFIKKYVAKGYENCVDYSLCGIHVIALENVNHWKGKYGVKKLLHKFNPNEKLSISEKELDEIIEWGKEK